MDHNSPPFLYTRVTKIRRTWSKSCKGNNLTNVSLRSQPQVLNGIAPNQNKTLGSFIQAALARTSKFSDTSAGSMQKPLLIDLGTVTVKTPSSYPAEMPSSCTLPGSLNFLSNFLAGSVDSSTASVLIMRYLESSTSTFSSSFRTPTTTSKHQIINKPSSNILLQIMRNTRKI